ncbi:MAG: hypothetical protein J1E41_06785 [Ruminococcus sp.]|nr:hypothetical protein [Ruminococcus sp.]
MKLRITKAIILTALIISTIVTTSIVAPISASAKSAYHYLFAISAREYTGKKIQTAYYKDYKQLKGLKKGKDYTVSYKNNVKIGQDTAKEIVTYKGKYKNRKQIIKKFSIAPPAPKIISKSYNSKTRTLTIKFKHNKNAKYVFLGVVAYEFDVEKTKYIKNNGNKTNTINLKLKKGKSYRIGLKSTMTKKSSEATTYEAEVSLKT